jgi:PAT family beta-lactamase induction signal transducer AmpG
VSEESQPNEVVSISANGARAPHPFVWTILYLPFGALNGFVTVALTFLATKHGLSISEGALLNGAQMLTNWLKWMWAPIVDITLTPRKWYVLSTAFSAVGVFAMAAVPLGPDTLGILIAIIAAAAIINSAVGMAVEAIIAGTTKPDQVGRVSAWLQAGNLGGTGLGGALGLVLVTHLPKPWMGGAVMGVLFMACCGALLLTPEHQPAHSVSEGAFKAVKGVVKDIGAMLKTKGGLLSGVLCILPVSSGAAQVVLTQSDVAAYWGAGAGEVELVQGLTVGLVTAVGCFVGGYLCQRIAPRTAYALIGVAMALVASGMALSPATVTMYVVFNITYAFTVGLAYAAFTAVVLGAIGHGSGATKYNVYASASNFPLWWLGLLLGVAAQKVGPRGMLFTEAGLGVVGVLVFVLAVFRVRRSTLPDALPDAVLVPADAPVPAAA